MLEDIWVCNSPLRACCSKTQFSQWRRTTVKHRRGTRGAVPASDAATRKGRLCSRVPSRPAASCHMAFVFFKPTRADAALTRAVSAETAETADSGRNSRKKKKVQNAPFELNIKPSFSSLHTTHTKFSSLPLTLSVTHSSLTLSMLFASVSACCETLSQCRVSHLTHFNSFFLQLSLTHS